MLLIDAEVIIDVNNNVIVINSSLSCHILFPYDIRHLVWCWGQLGMALEWVWIFSIEINNCAHPNFHYKYCFQEQIWVQVTKISKNQKWLFKVLRGHWRRASPGRIIWSQNTWISSVHFFILQWNTMGDVGCPVF